MDKCFLFVIIIFFILCATCITWAALEGPKRSRSCKYLAYGYVSLTWLCIIVLTVLSIIY